MKEYFENTINNNDPHLVPHLSLSGDTLSGELMSVNYDTREKLRPCILVPVDTGQISTITDINGTNITNSYAMYVGMDLLLNPNRTVPYIVYISRRSFDNDDEIVKSIKYTFIFN